MSPRCAQAFAAWGDAGWSAEPEPERSRSASRQLDERALKERQEHPGPREWRDREIHLTDYTDFPNSFTKTERARHCE